MRWIDALREWNAGAGKWCIPKKGTEEYDAVRALMGPKVEKVKKMKAENAPKEAKAPKASLQDMAAAVGVPMKQMKASAADYYKRVDNADPESRALLMERMPAQLRAGWEKHLASKAPKDAPAVRRVLKKKPVMVAVPDAPPAPAVKETRDMRNRRIAGEEMERYGKEQTVRALNNLLTYWRDMGEGREKKNSSFRKGVLADVETALLHYPRDSIPEYAIKMYLKTEKGKNMLTQPENLKRFKKRGGSIA